MLVYLFVWSGFFVVRSFGLVWFHLVCARVLELGHLFCICLAACLIVNFYLFVFIPPRLPTARRAPSRGRGSTVSDIPAFLYVLLRVRKVSTGKTSMSLPRVSVSLHNHFRCCFNYLSTPGAKP